jgi:predicted  nucleic acid-binding Zn-ribbon protein
MADRAAQELARHEKMLADIVALKKKLLGANTALKKLETDIDSASKNLAAAQKSRKGPDPATLKKLEAELKKLKQSYLVASAALGMCDEDFCKVLRGNKVLKLWDQVAVKQKELQKFKSDAAKAEKAIVALEKELGASRKEAADLRKRIAKDIAPALKKAEDKLNNAVCEV